MALKPVFETQAKPETVELYRQIKECLHLPHVPLFFAYMGEFPEYLAYITPQLTTNLVAPEFSRLNTSVSEQIFHLIREELSYSDDLSEWLQTYRKKPSFYHFQQDLAHVFETNMKLAFVFVALREAVKGWAVAAKKLPSSTTAESVHQDHKEYVPEAFIFETPVLSQDSTKDVQIIVETSPIHVHPGGDGISSGLVSQNNQGIEKQIMPEFMHLSRLDFERHMKRDYFWIMRVGIEKILLASLDTMPHLIFSPVNVVIDLTSKYPEFPELLHLLSEHFPTYAVQRMMFSGYMKSA
jgi:hypothetical protein